MKEMGLEIQKRAVLPANAEEDAEPEYQSLMNELHQSYSATRGRLILPIITKRVAEIAAVEDSVRDVVVFARHAIGYVRSVCLDEYDLWGEWFVGDRGVYDLLEALCEPLYDYLRPRTIHETKLAKLCELCTFIQTRYIDKDEDDEDDDDESMNGYPKRILDFATLVQPALQDAQTRLVFLALAVLRDEIELYKPKPEDLEYPKKHRRTSSAKVNGKSPAMSGRRNSIKETPAAKKPGDEEDDKLNGGFDSQWGMESTKQSQTWYPTLPKAVRLLSRIYRLVNVSTTL